MDLAATVKSLSANPSGRSDDHSSSPQHPSPHYIGSASQRLGEPREPQFVGPTRSAFSFNIAESSLARMGIPTDTSAPVSGAPSISASSREQTPELNSRSTAVEYEPDCLLAFSNGEVVRLLETYQEEVVSVHPFMDVKELVASAPHILHYVRITQQPRAAIPGVDAIGPKIGKKDVHILKLAIATAVIHESHGRNHLATKLVESVEPDVCRISNDTEVQLKDLQIMTMLVSQIAYLMWGCLSTNPSVEHFLLSRRGRTIGLEDHRYSRQTSPRDGLTPQTEPYGQFYGQE